MVDPEHDGGTPRWVKVFLIVAAALVLVALIALASSRGGPHGPRRHLPAGMGRAPTAASLPS